MQESAGWLSRASIAALLIMVGCAQGGSSPAAPGAAGFAGGAARTPTPTPTPLPTPTPADSKQPTPTPTPWDAPPSTPTPTPTPWDAPPTTPTPNPDASCAGPPVLVIPAEGHVVRQNDPTIGCPSHPTRGHGHQLDFDWEDACLPGGVSGYQIYSKAITAPNPVIDTFVTESRYTYRCCNCHVVERHRPEWRWRVRARDRNGNWGEWSAERKYSFESCRLSDGSLCNASQPGLTSADGGDAGVVGADDV